MAVMIKRAYELQTKQAVTAVNASGFMDEAEIPQWALEAVRVLKDTGIMLGQGNNRFVPKASVNRAEAAQCVYRLIYIEPRKNE